MEERRIDRHPRSQHFLNTVALGSLLVFASVTPPLSPPRDDNAAPEGSAVPRPEPPASQPAEAA